MPKQRIMRDLKIAELSAVDTPAQEGARMTILKRADSDGINKEDKMTEKTDIEKKLEELEKAHKEQGEAHVAEINKLNATVVAEKALGSLTDAEKAHYATLDETAKAAFLKADKGAREAAVAKAAEKDAVVYTSKSGEIFRKSDDPRLVTMAKRDDVREEELKVSKAAQETVEFTKRAETELKHLPGEVTVKVEALKALNGISDEKVREGAFAMLKASDAGLAKAFDVVGGSGGEGNPESPLTKLEGLAKKYATDNKVDYAVAYTKVLDTAEGNALYVESEAQKVKATT